MSPIGGVEMRVPLRPPPLMVMPQRSTPAYSAWLASG